MLPKFIVRECVGVWLIGMVGWLQGLKENDLKTMF